MVYQIKPYFYEKAKLFNVEIRPSTRKTKKIDLYKDKKYICSIGNINYYDYPTYIQNNGITYANERHKLYKIRHTKDRNVKIQVVILQIKYCGSKK